jgi:choline dehydrogenase
MVSAQSSIQSNSTDVIAVGAGSSGSAVVRRLVDAGLRVTVLEAGPPDDREAIHDPAGNIMELFGSEYDWSYEYLPQPHAGGRTNPQSKGRTLDRSSAINGFIYVHGNADDYNHWAALGAYGWDWASVEPYYCRLENYSEGGGGGRGVGGPVGVPRAPRINAIASLYWGLLTRGDDVEKVFSPPAVTGAGSSS